MDPKTIGCYLRMKGMSLDAIHENLVRAPVTDAMVSFTVTKYARNANFVSKQD
jgi:hypothetical protein